MTLSRICKVTAGDIVGRNQIKQIIKKMHLNICLPPAMALVKLVIELVELFNISFTFHANSILAYYFIISNKIKSHNLSHYIHIRTLRPMIVSKGENLQIPRT